MDIKESDKLHETISELISKSNSWDRLINFFVNNKEIEPYYKMAQQKACNCQYFGTDIICILTIEKLLDEIQNLKDELQSYDNQYSGGY